MSDIEIPHAILVDIVHRVGRESYLRLGPIMVTDRHGLAAVRADVVIRKTNITDFISNAELVRADLPYWDFFVRCLNSGNELAYLLEGLRVAYNDGDVFQAIHFIERAYMKSPLTVYILEMFQICAGSFCAGDATLRHLR